MVFKNSNNTSTSIKNVPSSQKLLLVKNYLEQKLESQGYRGHVKYDRTNKALIQFRAKEGVVAVLQDGKLCLFEIPMKKFKGAYPLEVQPVDMDSIKTEKATCCKRCHSWKQPADITRCVCGGYLVQRKRFSTGIVPSWDEQFLEIEFAKKDIRAAERTDRILSHRPRRYQSTGITPKLSGISSIQTTGKTHSEELLLIPSGDEVKTVQVRPILSCSLIFVAAISEGDRPLTDSDKLEILKKYNREPTDDAKDRQFNAETKAFIIHTTPVLSAEMIDSWNHTSKRQSKVYKRKADSLEKKWDGTELRRLDYKYGNLPTKKDHKEKNQHIVQSFASSLPVPTASQKI